MRCDPHTAGLSSFVSLLPTLLGLMLTGLTLTGPIGCGDSASHAKPSGPKEVTVGVLTVQPRELRDVVALSLARRNVVRAKDHILATRPSTFHTVSGRYYPVRGNERSAAEMKIPRLQGCHPRPGPRCCLISANDSR